MIEGWHGSHSHFSEFDYEKIGSGEGGSLGYGIYVAENRKGGEYFSEYMNFRHGSGYLYRVTLHFEDHESLNLDSTTRRVAPAAINIAHEVLGTIAHDETLRTAYLRTRMKRGDKETAQALLHAGIKTLKADEDTNTAHGATYLVLNKSVIKILEVFRYVRANHSWEKITQSTSERGE